MLFCIITIYLFALSFLTLRKTTILNIALLLVSLLMIKKYTSEIHQSQMSLHLRQSYNHTFKYHGITIKITMLNNHKTVLISIKTTNNQPVNIKPWWEIINHYIKGRQEVHLYIPEHFAVESLTLISLKCKLKLNITKNDYNT